jgi:hypothetical protein
VRFLNDYLSWKKKYRTRDLQKSDSQLYQKLLDKKSYFSDIFDKLNRLSTSSKGPNASTFKLFDKSSGFMKKILHFVEAFVKATP